MAFLWPYQTDKDEILSLHNPPHTSKRQSLHHASDSVIDQRWLQILNFNLTSVMDR